MRTEPQRKATGIVVDGPQRALAGAEQDLAKLRVSVAADIEAKYSSRLSKAGFLYRCWLRIQMGWEIDRLMREAREKAAPRGALYAKQ